MPYGDIAISIGALYGIIAVFAFAANDPGYGPVTLGLAVMRGAFWPLWLMGWLAGERTPMD